MDSGILDFVLRLNGNLQEMQLFARRCGLEPVATIVRHQDALLWAEFAEHSVRAIKAGSAFEHHPKPVRPRVIVQFVVASLRDDLDEGSYDIAIGQIENALLSVQLHVRPLERKCLDLPFCLAMKRLFFSAPRAIGLDFLEYMALLSSRPIWPPQVLPKTQIPESALLVD